MFQHQLKHGVQVSREFAKNLPRIRAHGNALNQIWTNLIDNALDAMESLPPGQPKALLVRTCAEPDGILVEIGDNGPGIPLEDQERIFGQFERSSESENRSSLAETLPSIWTRMIPSA